MARKTAERTMADIGIVLDDAMRAIEKENAKLRDVLPKIYAGPAIDKRVLGDVVAARASLG